MATQWIDFSPGIEMFGVGQTVLSKFRCTRVRKDGRARIKQLDSGEPSFLYEWSSIVVGEPLFPGGLPIHPASSRLEREYHKQMVVRMYEELAPIATALMERGDKEQSVAGLALLRTFVVDMRTIFSERPREWHDKNTIGAEYVEEENDE